MTTRTMAKRFWLAVIPVALMASLLLPSAARSEEPPAIAIETSSPQRLSLTVGKSVILKSQTPMKRVSVGSMETADVLVLSPQQVSITGKALGVTNVTFWKKDDEVASVIDVEVSPDISRLEEMLHQLLPEERNIQLSATHDSITLSGTVSSPGSASQALALAEPYFPKKVVNLMKVESPPDVSRLRESLGKALPEEKNIQISTASDGVTLSGTVSSKGNLSQALALAESQFPKKVTNALKVEISPSRFKEILYQVLPDEKDIRVT